jgi:predicted DNA-binding transcriptional regulator AlpA
MTETRTDLPPREVWDVRQAAAFLGMSDRTLQRLDETGEGPPRVQLSTRRVGYLRGDIDAWLKQRRSSSKAAA